MDDKSKDKGKLMVSAKAFMVAAAALLVSSCGSVSDALNAAVTESAINRTLDAMTTEGVTAATYNAGRGVAPPRFSNGVVNVVTVTPSGTGEELSLSRTHSSTVTSTVSHPDVTGAADTNITVGLSAGGLDTTALDSTILGLANRDSDELVFVVVEYSPPSTTGGTDWLAGGIWFEADVSGGAALGFTDIDNIEIGAFFDAGMNTPDPARWGTTDETVTYSSDRGALGVYSIENGAAPSLFGAAVDLTATIPASSTSGEEIGLSGAISDFRDGEGRAISELSGVSLTLGSANTPANGDDNYAYGGPTTMNVNGVVYGGFWSGQFYGDLGEYTAGTFGAGAGDVTNDERFFLGSFVAEQSTP